MPDFTAAPFPFRYGWRITVAPAPAACVPVPSVDPSSITRIWCQAAAAFSSETTDAMAAASLQAGMTTETARGSAIVPLGSLVLGFDRRPGLPQFHHADTIQQVLEQLAGAGDDIGQQSDQ